MEKIPYLPSDVTSEGKKRDFNVSVITSVAK